MWRYVFSFSILLLIFFPSRGQTRPGQPEYLVYYQQAEKLYHSADPTQETDSKAQITYGKVIEILTREKIFNTALSDSYLKSGILEMSSNLPGSSITHFLQAISVVQKGQLSDSLIFQPCIYAGTIYYSLNNLDSAIYYFKKAELVYGKYPGLEESERLFNKFGALYYETGDYNKSISYFEKALSLVQEKKPVNVFFVINYKNNIATALLKLGKYNQALEIFRELLKYPEPGDALFYNIGNTYFEEGNDEQAVFFLKKIRHMDFEKFNSLTKIYIRLKKYDSAGTFLNLAQKAYQQNQNFSSKITYGITLKYAGDLKAAAGKPMEALADYQSALIHLDPDFHNVSLAGNPLSFSGLLNFSFLFETLVAKASTLHSMGSLANGTQWQKQSLRAYASALALAKYMEKTYFSDDARLFLKTKVNSVSQDAVEVAIQLYNKTKDAAYVNIAFGLSEDNKATVLQTGLRNLELGSIPGLPVALVSEEKKLKTLLAKLEIDAARLKDSLTLVSTQKKIHNAEISLAALQNKLDENPQYHNLKFSQSYSNIDSIQKNITDPEQAILSYYYTAEQLICFYITKETSGFSAVPLNKNLFSTIKALRKSLEDPDAAGRKSMHDAGAGLYADLLLPVFEKIKDKHRLLIIPFNEINYVPFEMIVLENGSLVLDRFAIAYNYAAGLITDQKPAGRINYQVLAMAPFAEKENANLILPALPASGLEIEQLPGKQFMGPAATKNQFVRLSGQYPVIHLATHAVANDMNLLGSYIEFFGLKKDSESDHRLYEKEIYTLDLKTARLVILSACETGNGLLVNGEGVISLSRAFSYAGCKSVVTSLWKADDVSTAYITKRFHHYLQKGTAIDIALQKAKMDYLSDDAIDPRHKNPAFWANLVLIGDYRAIVESGTNPILWGILLAAGCLIVFIAIKRKNRAPKDPVKNQY